MPIAGVSLQWMMGEGGKQGLCDAFAVTRSDKFNNRVMNVLFETGYKPACFG